MGPRRTPVEALYLDTSCIASFVVEGHRGVAKALHRHRSRVASVLSFVELDRVILRTEKQHALPRKTVDALKDAARELEANTDLVPMTDDILERARDRFPEEPVRALDAIHLATLLQCSRMGFSLAILTHDRQLKRNAELLRFRVIDPLQE
jgi:predicted nucleic acid-binding protein